MTNHLNSLFVIGGSVYQIDKKERAILPFNGQGKVIREKELQPSGSLLTAGFNLGTLELVPIVSNDKFHDMLIKIRIPRQCFDPIVFPKPEEVVHFNGLSKRNRWGITFLDEQITARIQGTLPIVDVAGVRYDLNLESQVLRSKSGKYPDLPMSSMEIMPDGPTLAFAFNRESRRIVDIGKGAESQSISDIFFIKIDNLIATDPVGMSKYLGLNDGWFITPEQGYKSLSHARAIPIEKIIKSNSLDPFSGSHGLPQLPCHHSEGKTTSRDTHGGQRRSR